MNIWKDSILGQKNWNISILREKNEKMGLFLQKRQQYYNISEIYSILVISIDLPNFPS